MFALIINLLPIPFPPWTFNDEPLSYYQY